MTTTPHGATELVSAQATPETTVNQQVRHTEAGACHFVIADNDLTAPPGACADGANYIIAATATGIWTGKETQIAVALGTNAASGWTYHVPKEGYTAYIQDENARHIFDGAAWAVDTTGGSFSTASTTEVLTGTDSAKGATPDAIAALWEQGSDVASAGTISLGEGGYFSITGTTTITDIDFATDKAGRRAWLKFAGILTLTNGASLILPTGANIVTAAGDTAEFVSEGSDVVRCVAYTRADGTALVGGGYSPGGTDVAIADGGTGASTAAAARTNLGADLYLVAFFATTAPTSSEVLCLHIVTDAFDYPANFASPASRGVVGSNPAATFDIDVQRQVNATGAFATIGTISISAGGAFTFTTASGTAKSIAVNDVLKFVAPASADASIANLAVTLRGSRT